MNTAPTTKKFFQLVNIDDYRFSQDCDHINYGDIASDCDSKTISLLEAIHHIGSHVASLAESGNKESNIINLSLVISDLAEVAIATNKISQTAAYLSGIKDANHGA